MDWANVLEVPRNTLAGDKTIPKTVLTKQGDLTKKEQGHLKTLKRLGHYATVAQANARIAAVQDDRYDIASVIYLHCELARDEGTRELLDVLHKVFPNPTVLLLDGLDGKVGVSASIKRRSLAAKGTVVVERVETVLLFDPLEPAYVDYLNDIRHASLPQSNLLDYVSALCDRTAKATAIEGIGEYPRCKDSDTLRLTTLLDRLKGVQTEINALRTRYRDKNASLAETSRVRMALKRKEGEHDKLATEIKEICHG